VTQVAVCSQINTKYINTVWAELTIVKIFNLLVHPVTSRLYKVNKPGSMRWMGLAHCTDTNTYIIMFGKNFLFWVDNIKTKRILKNYCERAWTESIGGSCVEALEYSGIIDVLSEG
jgi:hypothetical protein